MAFGILVNSAAAAGVNAVNTDFLAASDPDWTARNNHYIFSDDFNLSAIALIGASVTRGRLISPTLSAVGELTLFAAARSASVPANPYVQMFMPRPLNLPKNEEIQVQASNNLGAATEQETAVLWLTTEDWNSNLPQPGPSPFDLTGTFRATFAVTPTVNAWSGGQVLTLPAALRNGVYAVIGCRVQGANALAFRWIFPKFKLYRGRRMRPGGLIQNAVGDVPSFNWPLGDHFWGEWGRFHTFELPQIEVFGITAGAITYQVFMDLVYLGTDESLLSQGLGAA